VILKHIMTNYSREDLDALMDQLQGFF